MLKEPQLPNTPSQVEPKPDVKPVQSSDASSTSSDPYQTYIEYFEKVYKTMDENYYKPVSREAYDNFITKFTEKIYSQFKGEGKSDNYVKWRSASLLIQNLKDPEDIFSELYPPKPAQEYHQQVLGQRVDIGLEGELTEKGYELSQVEPRSDSYIQGIRIGHIIKKIEGKDVTKVTPEEFSELLNPLIDTKVKVTYFDTQEKKENNVEVLSKEYFKQEVFPLNIPIPGYYGLKLEHFNRMTSEDMWRYLTYFNKTGPIKGLVIDLRGNPGGPPLAALEIASFFLPIGSPFLYFQKKGQPRTNMEVAPIQYSFKYDGPLVILTDKGTGSAAEMFSGVMHYFKRAFLMGENTAGQVMLKSMFPLEDESMILLVTGRGYLPNGEVFKFEGLYPDKPVAKSQEDEMIKLATAYLVYLNNQKSIVK